MLFHHVHKNEAVNISKWRELLDTSTFTNPWQSVEFYQVCNSIKRLKANVYALQNNQGYYDVVCVVCIQQGKGLSSVFTKRAIIYGGPLLAKNYEKASLNNILQFIEKDLRYGTIYLEVRNYNDYCAVNHVFKELLWSYIPYLNIKLKLKYNSLEELKATFKYNRKREIRLTKEAGLGYRLATSTEEIEKLYAILKKLYKLKVKLPLPPLNYFVRLWETGLMKIFVVVYNDCIVGGSFCMVNGLKTIYTYYYCGKRKDEEKIYPTHLAVVAAMDWGIRNGIEYLDFMGAGKPGIEYGVRRYKMGFGGDLVEEGRYLKILNKPLFWVGKTAIKINRRISN